MNSRPKISNFVDVELSYLSFKEAPRVDDKCVFLRLILFPRPLFLWLSQLMIRGAERFDECVVTSSFEAIR